MSQSKPSNKAVVATMQYAAERDGISFLVNFTEFSEEIIAAAKQVGAEQFLKNQRAGTLKNTKGEVLSQC